MELDVQRPVLLAPGDGETVTDRPRRTLRILGELEDVIVTWFRYGAGEKGPDPHVHHHHTDAFYVLEGEIEVSLGPELQTSNLLDSAEARFTRAITLATSTGDQTVLNAAYVGRARARLG